MSAINKGRGFAYILLLSAFVSAFAFILSGSWIKRVTYPIARLDEGFTIHENGVLLEETRPERAMQDTAKKGDVYVMETVLPDDTVPSAALKIYSMHAIVDCYLDDTLIYSYGVRYLERYRFVPQGYHLVPLPADYAGKTLRLQYTSMENHAFFSLHAVRLGNIHDLVTDWIDESRIVIFIGVFLVLFGFLMAFLSLLMHIYENSGLQMFAGGLVAMNLGLFALCYYNAFFFVSRNLMWSTTIEYYAQFLIPLMIAAFMRLTTTDKRIRPVFGACMSLSLLMSLIATLLHITRYVPLTQSIIVYQRFNIANGFVMVLAGITILRRRFLQYRRLRTSAASTSTGLELASGMILLIGIFVVLLALLLEALLYQVTRYSLVLGDGVSSHFISLTGMAVFAILIMMSYFYHGIGVTYERSQSIRLETLAYTDTLTALPNRAYCKWVLGTLEASGRGYCIISMDVNFLKEVNDTKGHLAGDELLKNFADVLRTSFRSSDVVGRLSGDEFIAILRGASLTESIEKARQMAKELPFSISYGCAHSSEVTAGGATEVYRLADARMYEMKEEIHAKHA